MSKPKEYRVCAFCGSKEHKSSLLRVSLPKIIFDFWQNLNGRGFYVCQNSKCIDKVFKKKTVFKYLEENQNLNTLSDKLKNSIKEKLIYNIAALFDNFNNDAEIKHDNYLVLYRYDACCNKDNYILLDKALYSGSKEFCIVYNKKIIERLIKYKNIITNIDCLFYGELNGSKKS